MVSLVLVHSKITQLEEPRNLHLSCRFFSSYPVSRKQSSPSHFLSFSPSRPKLRILSPAAWLAIKQIFKTLFFPRFYTLSEISRQFTVTICYLHYFDNPSQLFHTSQRYTYWRQCPAFFSSSSIHASFTVSCSSVCFSTLLLCIWLLSFDLHTNA